MTTPMRKYWGRELERDEASPYVNPTQCGYTAVYKAADVDPLLAECMEVIIASHSQSKLLRKQLESGELARRLTAIGPEFDPVGRIKLLLKLQALLKALEGGY